MDVLVPVEGLEFAHFRCELIPVEHLRDVRLGSGQAQKAYEAGGLILITWQLGDRHLDTGFRADDADAHRATATALSELLTSLGGTP